MSYNIYPICLPPPGANFTGQEASVIGWGRTHSGYPKVVMEANVTILDNSDCMGIYSQESITAQTLCAKGPFTYAKSRTAAG